MDKKPFELTEKHKRSIERHVNFMVKDLVENVISEEQDLESDDEAVIDANEVITDKFLEYVKAYTNTL